MVSPVSHKRDQLLHKLSACPDNILKLINHQNFFVIAIINRLYQNIAEGWEIFHLVPVSGKLPTPLIDLLPLGTCPCMVIITRFTLSKLSYKSRLPNLLLSIYDQNLASFPVIIIIQISQL